MRNKIMVVILTTGCILASASVGVQWSWAVEEQAAEAETSKENYYRIATLISEDYWLARGKGAPIPPKRIIEEYKKLIDLPDLPVKKAATRGLKAYVQWQMWVEALAKEGLQPGDIQAMQKRWSGMLLEFGVSTMEGPPPLRRGGSEEERYKAENARRESEAYATLSSNFGGMIAETKAKGRMDSLKLDRLFDYQETKRKIWEANLLRFPKTFAGREATKPQVLIFRSFRRRDADTSRVPTVLAHCFKVRNTSGRTLNNCTLSVTITGAGAGQDHRAYFFPSLKPNTDIILRQGVRPWTFGNPAEQTPVVTVKYSMWSEEASETNKSIQASLQPADKNRGERFRGKVLQIETPPDAPKAKTKAKRGAGGFGGPRGG